MNTAIFHEDLIGAAELLKAGGLVAVPTETVYGLAGNGTDPTVIERIYEVKDRPPVKPISLMVPGAERIDGLCEEVPKAAKLLAERFWPGPLTLVLRARPAIPAILRAGGATVGLRCPKQEQTLRLLRELPFPLAVPSANPSGKPSPKSADEVLAYFNGRIEGVIDGGTCDLGVESTLLDLTRAPYRILRRGALSEEAIADALVDGMQIVGITGGSGSGKSTALKALEARGALALDCDRVYHELLENDGELIAELAEAFPEAAEERTVLPNAAYAGRPEEQFAADGLDGGPRREKKISRRRLAEAVFQDPEKLRELNRITHRHITVELQRRLRVHAMNGGRLAALDAIELIGSGLAERCAWVLAVTAPEETRVARIVARDGITEEQARSRIRAQKPDRYFEERCDVTLRNDGSEAAFLEKTEQIMEERLWKTGTRTKTKP